MTQMNVKIRKLHADAIVPSYATAGAAGFDLYAVEDVIIAPGETKKVPLGLAFEIPEGYVMYVCMRSGIALKTKLRLPNGIGVIDSDYRGEVSMMFDNIGFEHDFPVPDDIVLFIDGSARCATKFEEDGSYHIRKGDRIAQGVIVPISRASFEVVDELSETQRGDGGFGHTGVYG